LRTVQGHASDLDPSNGIAVADLSAIVAGVAGVLLIR
jgi:hypothetical protein